MQELLLQTGRQRGDSYFIKELSNEEFISYGELTTLAGVTQGTLINEGSGWLQFEMDGVELVVAKANIRHSINWDHLNSLGYVDGTGEVMIQGRLYKLRLLRGADMIPFTFSGTGNFVEGTHNSEWSRLFYPIVSDDPYLDNRYLGPRDPRYTMTQLQMNSLPFSWCQETASSSSARYAYRGYRNPTYFNSNPTANTAVTHRGWRPCLELIPPMQSPNLKSVFYFNRHDLFQGPTRLRGSYLDI